MEEFKYFIVHIIGIKCLEFSTHKLYYLNLRKQHHFNYNIC